MVNYSQDPNGMALPWIESPFFYPLRDYKQSLGRLTQAEADLCTQFHEQGYVVLDLELTDQFIAELLTELDTKIMEGAVKTQDGRFHYGNGPRVFEAWKWSSRVRDIACHPKVLHTLKLLYGRNMNPFQTINFKHGSNQPIHSDAVHFHTQPERWVCGVWTALQDIDDRCGPLVYYPRSHRYPIVEFQELNMEKTAYGEQFDNYHEYENWLQQWVEVLELERRTFTAKKGQALVWAANLVHGGAQPQDFDLTRWSQATHYYAEGCRHYYTPFFSNRWEGDYSEKDLSGKDILGQQQQSTSLEELIRRGLDSG